MRRMMTIGLFRNATDTRDFPAGATIFREGESGHEMFVIRRGAVDIVVGDHTITTLAEGEIFGEMALIDTRPRSATAKAREDCAFVPVDEKRFTFLVQQTPQFALHVMRTLADRLRSADRRI